MMYTYNMVENPYILLREYPRILGSSDKVVVKLAGRCKGMAWSSSVLAGWGIAGIGSQRF